MFLVWNGDKYCRGGFGNQKKSRSDVYLIQIGMNEKDALKNAERVSYTNN